MSVNPGPNFTALGAAFYPDADVVYRDANCTAVRLREGREPASLNAGRVEAWVVSGPVLGHVDPRPDGNYQAAVRATLPHGTRLAGSVAGTAVVPAHRFRSPARVPQPVRTTAPSAGFRSDANHLPEVRWEGGDSSHVTLQSSFTRGPLEQSQDGLVLTCVVPRTAGSFTLPASAARVIPDGADTVALVVTATDRVQEGDYAFDVSPIGSADDVIRGTFTR